MNVSISKNAELFYIKEAEEVHLKILKASLQETPNNTGG